jgi:hypothetical protein
MASYSIASLAALDTLRQLANRSGEYVGLLGIRLLLAWEFGEAGIEKLRGENWFHHIQDEFPFPFSALPASVSWQLATWSEVLGAIAPVAGNSDSRGMAQRSRGQRLQRLRQWLQVAADLPRPAPAADPQWSGQAESRPPDAATHAPRAMTRRGHNQVRQDGSIRSSMRKAAGHSGLRTRAPACASPPSNC